MAQKVLQVNFKFSVSPEEYGMAVEPLADPIAAVEGLQWKVWIMNPAEGAAGGIYLFEDGEALAGYVGSDIVKGILAHPALSDFDIKTFDVMAGPSERTRAPLGEAMAS